MPFILPHSLIFAEKIAVKNNNLFWKKLSYLTWLLSFFKRSIYDRKTKNQARAKIVSLFLSFRTIGVAEIMSIIFWQFDLSTTDYFYLVLNSLTILLLQYSHLPKTNKTRNVSNNVAKTLDYLLTLLAFWLIYAYYGKLLFVGANPDLIWCFSVTHLRSFWWLYNPWLLIQSQKNYFTVAF